jgi:hypothetical protein
LLVFTVSACELLSMERTPTEADIRAWRALQPFVDSCGEITGVYQNIDVDSVVFHCRGGVESEPELWRQLRERSAAVGWVEDSKERASGVVRTFQRLVPRRGAEQFSSSEELRIAWAGDRIVVGYVQADHPGEPTPVRETSEGRFAEKSIWPRFAELLSP